MTRQQFAQLSDEEARAYLLAELKSIVLNEAIANKELEDATGVRLSNISEQMLKRFK